KFMRDNQPVKLDIGPIYDRDLTTGRSRTKKALKREFVFDIDAGDYDTVRTCCKGAAVCAKCWALMEACIPIFDTVLR
ncbi:DNA primase, small subunit, eukaryotic/archaeal, partial [Kipferlia bialata]